MQVNMASNQTHCKRSNDQVYASLGTLTIPRRKKAFDLFRLPVELQIEIVSNFAMGDLLNSRIAGPELLYLTMTAQTKTAWKLQRDSKMEFARRLWKDLVLNDRTYDHLFYLNRLCAIADKLARYLSDRYHNSVGEPEEYPCIYTNTFSRKVMASKFRPYLILLAHFLEHHRLCLKDHVTDPRYFANPRAAVEVQTLCKYNPEHAWNLRGLHQHLVPALHERLQLADPLATDLPYYRVEQTYASLAVLGGLEALRDCIMPPTFGARIRHMRSHIRRSFSMPPATDGSHISLPRPPVRSNTLAHKLGPFKLSLTSLPTAHELAIQICDFPPEYRELVEIFALRNPKDARGRIFVVETLGYSAERDFIDLYVLNADNIGQPGGENFLAGEGDEGDLDWFETMVDKEYLEIQTEL